MSRSVAKIAESVEQNEGFGARVRRSIGRHDIGRLDPFLLLDEFRGSAPAGFPDHPHRGFQTVTYILNGKMKHEDFCGNSGVLDDGCLQWMSAGRGIVHCEMPYGDSVCHGLQLWINLKSADKMMSPFYKDVKNKSVQIVQENGVKIKVISGECKGVKTPLYTKTPVLYLDIKMNKNQSFDQPIPESWNAFAYVLKGSIKFGNDDSEPVKSHNLAIFKCDNLNVSMKSMEDESHFILVAGEPIKESVVQHGPFVMNTQEEINQTISDYRQGKNGFEKARSWNSSYAD